MSKPLTFSLRSCLAAAAVTSALLVGATGCGGSKPQQSSKQAASQRWNTARAGVLLTLARDQYSSGNFEKCRKTLDDALKLDAENPQVHLLSAKLSLEQGQLELAERELIFVRTKLPNEGEPHYLSGVIYQRWQKPERAYECYKAASERAPSEQAYVLAEAESLVALDRRPEALALLQGKAAYFENSAAIRDAIGQLLVQSNRYHEAADILRQASLLSPDDEQIREQLGIALYYDKQYKDARDVLEKVIAEPRNNKRTDLLLAYGECQLESGQPREARQTFERLIELDPASSHGYLGVGRAALESNDLKRAELSLKKAQSLEPSHSEPYLLTGYLRLRQNRLNDALASFQKASSLDKRDPVSVCMVGYVYEKLGKNDLAVQYYGKALKLKPQDELASKLMAGVNLND
jgi:Tfp pilus assembly protein PilF